MTVRWNSTAVYRATGLDVEDHPQPLVLHEAEVSKHPRSGPNVKRRRYLGPIRSAAAAGRASEEARPAAGAQRMMRSRLFELSGERAERSQSRLQISDLKHCIDTAGVSQVAWVEAPPVAIFDAPGAQPRGPLTARVTGP